MNRESPADSDKGKELTSKDQSDGVGRAFYSLHARKSSRDLTFFKEVNVPLRFLPVDMCDWFIFSGRLVYRCVKHARVGK
jgi:hypothetical protein